MDAEPSPEESQGWGDDWDDEDTEEACKAFGVDKWKAFRKARDARKLKAAAKDEGASDSMSPYLTAASSRIGRDTYGGAPSLPTPQQCVDRGRAAVDSGDGGFEKRYPQAAHIRGV